LYGTENIKNHSSQVTPKKLEIIKKINQSGSNETRSKFANKVQWEVYK